MKKTSYIKDIFRTIKNEKKRFFSILIITALGVIMSSGLRAACVDLRKSADTFMDEQNLYDIAIQSTLGLTDDDVAALAALDDVLQAEGAFAETVYLSDETHESVNIKTISESGLNEPYLVSGTLPEAANEIAVTESYLEASNKQLGDTLTIEEIEDDDEEDSDEDDEDEEDEPSFYYSEFIITATVIDPANINNPDSTTSFRDTSTTDYTFFVSWQAVNSDIYTSVYLTVSGAAELNCYSDEYESLIESVTQTIEAKIKSDREQARTDEIISDAESEIAEAEEEMYDAFEEADEEIAEAEEELEDAREQLDEGWEEYYEGLEEIEDAEEELEEGEAELKSEQASARQQIADAKAELSESAAALEEAWAELEENEAELSENLSVLESGISQTESGIAQLEAAIAQIETALTQITASSADTGTGSSDTAVDTDTDSSDSTDDTDTDSSDSTDDTDTDSSDSTDDADTDSSNSTDDTDTDSSDSTDDTDADSSDSTDDADTDSSDSTDDADADSSDSENAATDSSDSTDNTDTASSDTNELTQEEQALAQQYAALLSQYEELTAQLEELKATLSQLNENLATLKAAQAALEEGRAELESAQAELDAGQAELEASEAEAEEQFASAWATIKESKAALNEAIAELEDGLAELEDGEAEYADGLAEFEESVAEYEEEKADALEEIADARAELEDIDTATWYVTDRTSLAGYSNVDSDSSAIEAIGNYFPVIFLAVAVLISLTTITRMVDEERGLIGTYKALGFTNTEIRRKYMLYSLCACFAGCIIGEFGGFIGLPAFVFIIFRVMYTLPEYTFTFDWLYGLAGPVIFFAGISFATWFACRKALKQRPAILMRPKAPKAGSRILLEKIPLIWKHLSFLNKVTARNLFRYKKRLTMTIVGIAGCTGLLLFGFAIRDSVEDFVVRQYGEIYSYDLMAVATDNDSLTEYMENENDISDYISVRIDSVTVKYDDSSMSIQMIIIPDEYADEIGTYITLSDTDGNILSISEGDVYITRNVGQMLDFEAGDTVSLQDLTLAQSDTSVGALLQNYLGNNVYMTSSTYEALFENEYEANGALAIFTDSVSNPDAWAQELAKDDGISSAIATQSLEDEFDMAFILLTMVVYIIIVMAALLAFVVLFTLSTTNISEREREIATIKVLGFHDKEVHTYVNKEMIILTVLGMLPGLVLGYFLGHGMTPILKMPGLYFAVSIHPVSYFISLGLTLLFAILVQFITNRVLNKIDPVEALKSIE